MELRLVEIYFPENKAADLQEILKQYPVLDTRLQKVDGYALMRALLPDEQTGKLTDELSNKFGGLPEFRVILMNVTATLPRPPEPPPKEEKKDEAAAEEAKPEESKTCRLNREEIYTSVSSSANITRNFIILSVLSTIVAAFGLQQNNLVVIVGAMVIAPLLGPNIALALATTLGDAPLARRALKAGALALVIVAAIAVILGIALNVNANIPEIAARTRVNLTSIVVALASGAAAALAVTTSLPTALIGVMVAVAILPPLATFGMLLGKGLWLPAGEALLLAVINIVCVNLAAIATFLFQGIRPATWWEKEKAKKSSRTAIILWLALLLVLAALIIISQR